MAAFPRLRGLVGLVAISVLAVACDGPAEPAAPVAAALEIVAGDDQTGTTAKQLPIAPAVRVLDDAGQPLAGVRVEFLVTRGGGRVSAASAVSGSTGIASAGTWTLGNEGLNELEARAGQASPAVLFQATATTPSAFAIDVRVVGTMSARQRQAVDAAVERWRSVIVTDLPDSRLVADAGTCFEAQPALNHYVDDLMLFIEFVGIDGPGQVLGEAGPCYVRSGSDLPLLGYLKLDVADLAKMESTGTLDDVVLHEIGHILGIGTLWGFRGLLSGSGGSDPRFTGTHAIAAYRGMGGLQSGVAVENTGGAGTRDGHWRESEFGNELMTGYVGSVPNPLSALTIASLQDLGYGASVLHASQYTLGTTFGRMLSANAALDVQGREKVRKPMYRVDRAGRRSKLPPL